MLRFVYIFLFCLFAINVNTKTSNQTDTWNGNWFPENPFKDVAENNLKIKTKTLQTNKNDTWKGKWFPDNPDEPEKNSFNKNDLLELFDAEKTETNTKESWKGKWFPSKPKTKINPSIMDNSIFVEPNCDDGKTNIKIDFDPEDKTHNYNYVCLRLRTEYEPSFATYGIQREFIIPPAFKAPSYCLNETIDYEERLPTFGAHRFLYPKYGEYKYLPPQRWMHTLEYGGIVMLYHPCANKMQVEKLRSTLSACAYRHVITPFISLLPKRPLAIVVWGKSLEMSVVDVSTVVDFIKNNGNKGPATGEPNVQRYDVGLITESKLVTDEQDSELCANILL